MSMDSELPLLAQADVPQAMFAAYIAAHAFTLSKSDNRAVYRATTCPVSSATTAERSAL